MREVDAFFMSIFKKGQVIIREYSLLSSGLADKPENSTVSSRYAFYMGGSSAGKVVTERMAMQMTAVTNAPKSKKNICGR